MDPSSHNTWERDGTAIRNPRCFVTWICRAKWNFTRVPFNKGVALSDNGRHEQRRCSTITETYSCPLGGRERRRTALDFPSVVWRLPRLSSRALSLLSYRGSLTVYACLRLLRILSYTEKIDLFNFEIPPYSFILHTTFLAYKHIRTLILKYKYAKHISNHKIYLFYVL